MLSKKDLAGSAAFTAQQHHDMTRLLRRKASETPESETLRRKAIGFLALAKTAHKQATATAATPPKAPPSLTSVHA